MTIYKIIFLILLIDSVSANLIIWSGSGKKWYIRHFQVLSKTFPASRGWSTLYLILVLFIGLLIF